jgi:hypothetical protein
MNISLSLTYDASKSIMDALFTMFIFMLLGRTHPSPNKEGSPTDMKKRFKAYAVIFLTIIIAITGVPTVNAFAKPSVHGKGWKNNLQDWHDNQDYWTTHWDAWNSYWQEWYRYWTQHTKKKDTDYAFEYADDYLVLIAKSDGTYRAYDDIAYVNSKNKLLVKTRPLSKALDIPYHQLAGNGKKKKSAISYELKKSLKINYKYFDTSSNAYYQYLGYKGVIIYSKSAAVTSLPAPSLITNLEDNPWYTQYNWYVQNGWKPPNEWYSQNGWYPQNDWYLQNDNAIYTTVKPYTVYHGSSSEYRYTEAIYQCKQANTPLLLNLSEVAAAFAADGLPSTGIYGYGHCDTPITLQGYNNANTLIGESKVAAGEFLIDFPTATHIKIIGVSKNLLLDFTPVKPIIINDTTSLYLNQIAWLYPKDTFARQYFILADHMRLNPIGINCSYDYSRRILNPNNSDPTDYANSYQRITVLLRHTSSEAFPSGSYLYAEKTSSNTNTNLVAYPDTGNAVLATDYAAKLYQMVNSLYTVGQNIYFPSKNWERPLIIKLADGTTNTAYNYVYLDASYLNLDYYYDYYAHLHEMTHFYEASQLHYGFRFEAWTEGNAATLAKKALDKMGISHHDPQGKDLLDMIYLTDFSFLTQDNRNDFESYYLNATGWNASLIGYHFTSFLQEVYGNDTVYRILQKVYAANIPTGYGRNSTYDKQFTDCIKAATSSNVFQMFVQYISNKK